MHEMNHRIPIKASPEAAFEALTTSDGLSKWWTGDSVAEPIVGSMAEFGFSNRTYLFLMEIEELVPAKRVVWRCKGNPDDWIGTQLTWDIEISNNGVEISFTHAGWASNSAFFASCNSTWGALMFRLRDYLEGKAPGPMFEDHID
jgi:uncharacterized protein YndB with AHSA1/START domain